MKKRPLVFSVQAWVFILLAVSFPLQIIFTEELSIGSWGRAFYLLTPLNWITIFTFILMAYLSFKASTLLKVALPLSFTIVAINNFVAMDILGEKVFENFLFGIGPATVAYSAFLYYVMFKSPQAYLLENPHLRWWRIAPRYQVSLPIWFAQKGKGLQRAQTFDLASGGIFVPMDICSHTDNPFAEGETLQIHLDLMGQVLQCRGKLARIEKKSKGNYPPGLGIKLDLTDYPTGQLLDSFIKGLANEQSMIH
ncbi:MAG: PilZ domain-containing protein [Bdellovibrio sp.]|nr:PilZ domain-containing protein [Bdellovibrio sp.]